MPQIFDETRFPTKISKEARSSPSRKTEVVTLASGAEERNAVWANSLRRYNVGYGIRSLDDMHVVTAFWESMNAQLVGFRMKDWADYKSCLPLQNVSATDQTIGVGDGANDTFQLKKIYAAGSRSWSRIITKPVNGTVIIAVGGVVKTAGVHYNLTITTGVVVFTPGNTPANTLTVSAGYEFDVPVRFETDTLDIDLSNYNVGEIQNIPLIEVKL